MSSFGGVSTKEGKSGRARGSELQVHRAYLSRADCSATLSASWSLARAEAAAFS